MLPRGPGENSPAARAQVDTAACGRAANHVTASPVIWRPWIRHIKDALPEKAKTGSSSQLSNMQGFHHPVRLFMPKSKTQEYLSHLGKKVLSSFPVQATLHFYNDDSSSEEESEDDEEMEA